MKIVSTKNYKIKVAQKLPHCNARELLKLLKKYYNIAFIRQGKGDHQIWGFPNSGKKAVIPVGNQDVKTKTLVNILHDLDINLQDFKKKKLKMAQFTDENTLYTQSPTITIQPFEPLVKEVVDELQSTSPGFFRGVNKINIDMGFGQFGSVKSDNPADINLNFNNIKQEVTNQIPVQFDINNPEHKEILKAAIKETIIHERGHIDDAWQAHEKDPEAGIGGADLFPGGERAAERYVDRFS